MKNIARLMAIAGIIFMLGAGVSFAEDVKDPGIKKREKIQQKRIDQGVKSGELTPEETKKLETQQAKIKKDEERMKADGKLTKKERAKLKKKQDRARKNIYKKKHNKKKADTK